MINADQLLTEVKRLCAENPDAVYTAPERDDVCYYTRGEAAGRAGCLFGQALTNLGAPLEVLTEVDTQEATGEDYPTGIPSVLTELGIETPEWLTTLFAQVQGDQDSGAAWRVIGQSIYIVETYGENYGGRE